MNVPTPHFLLFSESQQTSPSVVDADRQSEAGQWRFVLEAVDGSVKFEVADEEPEVRGDRLELLAVVRGLEALDQPSRVTLLTPSHYVSRGLRHGLAQWRESNWQWERFGKMAPVKDSDLWRRVDRALRYHQVDCRTWRWQPGEGEPAAPSPATCRLEPQRSGHEASRLPGATRQGWGGWLRRLVSAGSRLAQRWAGYWPSKSGWNGWASSYPATS